MTAIRDHFGVHASALVLRNERNELLASNIANAATPHFKARDIDFGAELNRRIGEGGNLATSNSRHFNVGGTMQGGVGYRDPVNSSLDGNTVELSVEQMEFSENTVRYQASLTLLNRKISGLAQAIKGE
ncbi:flagellar basal body rod protein FlgB [Pseudoprimorskyibacter insulae]|uniref:Flagellar basal body rod protein FlgB n=1 Tax=Pseudoprimorskyibacter insulae TaxID=1695997 RepID=A0A2R8AVR1_9RHOB|nr:flagellar basal body rod protein FlgB [Pseudoprimorskyibacter insulae]SPF80115.1 Flagellar basal body rod protein FlgB [Pseudoprimorskyibacter insulae]